MEKAQLAKYDLPDVPGVYLFKQGRKVIYVGKATSLRDRVRSYFDDDLIVTRGPRLVDMVTKADGLAHEVTPTVLEALVKEAALIRKYRPYANVEGKDDKTFLYAVITDEVIPRVLAERGSNIDFKNKTCQGVALRAVYGPFPYGAQLREGLRLIRKIFPFFDTPKPVGSKGPSTPLGINKHQQKHIEFNRQIGQYPCLPAGRRAKSAIVNYRKAIRHVALFLAGKTKELRHALEKEMKNAAKDERFEDAGEARRQLFALDHIQDVSLIKDENMSGLRAVTGARIEAYDTAHISGTNAIGVMTVVVDGVPIKKEYRSFRIHSLNNDLRSRYSNNDIASLQEVLTRRLGHPEWPMAKAIVVDGGKTQKKAAEAVLAQAGFAIPVAAVVKNEKHQPREVLGYSRAGVSLPDAILANAEAHRFSLARHRAARRRAAGV